MVFADYCDLKNGLHKELQQWESYSVKHDCSASILDVQMLFITMHT